MKKNITKYAGFVLAGIISVVVTGCAQPEVKHEHTFSTAWEKDGTDHWHKATCGHDTEVSEKTAHTFPDTWSVVTAATEEANGLEERFCTVCSYRATQPIPQLNHVHTIATSWTTNDTKHWHAASCGKAEHNEDEASHTEDTGMITTVASCTTKGVKTFKCTVCGKILRTEDVNAKGHTENSGTVTTEATCVTKGVKTFKCSKCSKELKTEDIPELYSSPITEVVDGVTYVKFGVWPQTVLQSTSNVSVDESKSVVMGAHTYYLGSDGNYYAKCAENAYGTGDEYRYTDGTQARQGRTTTRYFKVEPIKWLVLTDNYSGRKFILAESIIIANIPYYNYKSSSNTRKVGDDTNIYPNNYRYSQIRAYLNGLDYYYDKSSTETIKISDYNSKGFYQTAFTSDAQALIAETQVDNSLVSAGYSTNSNVYDFTKDKIFLLSYKELYSDGYFESNTKRIRKATDYAMANYANQSSTDGYGGCWWLRSTAYGTSSDARYIIDTGSCFVYNVRDTIRGIVPALCLTN